MNVVMPNPGTYVVAVSGGVDSVALLHFLQNQPGLKLVVAHFDHGIRADSKQDRIFVQELAQSYGLPMLYDTAELGTGTSEAVAREARYAFLQSAQRASGARAIITAHHQDDVLETAIINLLRGTGRKGLTSLKSSPSIERPLLNVPKTELIAYAKSRNLVWHEDSTNESDDYLRNYIRHRITPVFDVTARQKLLDLINKSHVTNQEIDDLLVNQLHLQPKRGKLERHSFIMLPHAVAREVLATWLRSHEIRTFTRKTLERLVVAGKTATPGQRFPVVSHGELLIEADYLALRLPER